MANQLPLSDDEIRELYVVSDQMIVWIRQQFAALRHRLHLDSDD